MGPGTLEGRLSRRLLALTGAVLVAVGVTAAVMTERVLDAADTEHAETRADLAREALERELDEGTPPEQAVQEIAGESPIEAVQLAVRRPAMERTPGSAELPALAPGACTTFTDDHGDPWRACSSESARAAVVVAIPIAAHRAAVATLQRGMALIVLVALLSLWAAVNRTVRGALVELLGLVGWTTRIVDAEMPVPPPPARTLEVARLEEAFDALVRRLLESLARERAQSAHIAHELRTPLTAILAELDALADLGAPARSAVDRVRADVARLSDVIDAVLVLSARPSEPGPVRAVVNLADLARDLAPQGVRVLAPDEALVEGDERLLTLALRNLLDNARKYAGGAEAVEVTRAGDGVRLAVLDRGPGLDPDARARMFERYWRGTPDGEGRGLGLALVRAVAERHGGDVHAAPGAGGRGLDVSMHLGGVVGWHEEAGYASSREPTG